MSTLIRLSMAASLIWAVGSAYHLVGANQRAYFDAHSKDCLALHKAPPPGFNLWACGEQNLALWDKAGARAWDGVTPFGPVALGWLAYACVRIVRRSRLTRRRTNPSIHGR